MRMSNTLYRIRLRRFLRLPIPVCEAIGGGVGSSRPPRSAGANAHDVHGDFTLPPFCAKGANQWTELHDIIKEFFAKVAKQAGIGSVTVEKRADYATTRHRPGDVRIGSTRHGWKVASGKGLLLDVTTINAICASWRALCAAEAGAGAKQAMKDKADECHALGIIPEEQCFQALGFESEGHMCKEAGQLLHQWSRLWMERHEKTKGEADKLLHGWRMELAFLRAKYLAKCISERAQLSAETQDNEDAVRFDVRPPLASQIDLFATR
jgi:hypothetical protein